MNILGIARKELISQYRMKTNFLFMIALPILMIIILGTALTNAFSSNVSIGDMSLLYKSNIQNQQLAGAWEQFLASTQQNGIQATVASPDQDGKQAVQDDQYTAYVVLSDDGIQYFGGTAHALESNIIQGMLGVFADRYNLAAAAVKADPAAVQDILAASGSLGDFIQESSLNKEKQPGAMDYYSMAMSTMIAFYSSMPASYLIRRERLRKTGIRLSAAPIYKSDIFIGKVLASTLINFLCVLVVVLFSKWVFGADWGSHYFSVFLVLLTEVMLAVSFGLACSFLFKEGAERAVVMIVTQIISFIGGAYFPVDDGTGFLKYIMNISPLHWANQALMQIIYAGQISAALPVIGLNLLCCAVFLAISGVSLRRQEAI